MRKKLDQPSPEQLERAQRLRQQVERLKRHGVDSQPKAGESLKEQIEERAAEQGDTEPEG